MTETLPQSADQMTDILDIEPIFSATSAHTLRMILLALVFCLLLWVLYLFFTWLKTRLKKLRAKSPYETAVSSLKALQTEANKNTPAFYFVLTETLKRYLTFEHNLDVLDRTTPEILPLKTRFQTVITEYEWEKFKTLLTRSDEIKFAKAPVTPHEAEEDLKFSEELVESSQRKKSKTEAHLKAGGHA
jgi:hypothetical protein